MHPNPLISGYKNISVAAYTHVASDYVARVVNEECSRFEGRPIRDYTPLFVERHSADRLSKRVEALELVGASPGQ